ncbi:MAG: hypothetical protein P8M25_08500 [Paracoccaceae bacterium]|nr:hypothetical protein [Paracoccaceae bacterium]
MDWMEDPIWMDRIHDLRTLTNYTCTPRAGGKTLGASGNSVT